MGHRKLQGAGAENQFDTIETYLQTRSEMAAITKDIEDTLTTLRSIVCTWENWQGSQVNRPAYIGATIEVRHLFSQREKWHTLKDQAYDQYNAVPNELRAGLKGPRDFAN